MREHLSRIDRQLRRARAGEEFLGEQIAHVAEVAAELEARKLVAQRPLADRQWREARTDLERHGRLLDDTRRRVAELREQQDRLLERLFEPEGVSRRREQA